MAKGKQPQDKQPHPLPPQRPILSRLSFLYQAAALLTLPPSQQLSTSSGLCNSTGTDARTIGSTNPRNIETPESKTRPLPPLGLSRYYTSHLLSVSKKSVQRLSPQVKRSICKRCASVLIPGVSCKTRVDNQSKGGKRRWADILVLECNYCGGVKRLPVDEGLREKQRRRKGKATGCEPPSRGALNQGKKGKDIKKDLDGHELEGEDSSEPSSKHDLVALSEAAHRDGGSENGELPMDLSSG
ncbi:hypothetical protein ABW19_dt0201471 [Dactylella cylindrospora]|nr:hypothetical protein ABW19_dt0201471 [Dactylella cylindrospora]